MGVHQEKYIQVYIDYLIEKNVRVPEYEMIIYETIHILTRGE